MIPNILYSLYVRYSNYSFDYINAGIEVDGTASGFERLPIGYKNFNECYAGLYVGAKDNYVNCNERCNDESNSLFDYKFIMNKDNVIFNNKKLVGAYCLPKAVAKCNLNTSSAVLGKDGYVCVSVFPTLFGGPTGNTIIGCNGEIVDNLTKHTYSKTIPSDFVIADINEKLDDGRYRIECTDQENYTNLPTTIASRFDLVVNSCALLQKDARIDYEKMECVCSEGENLFGRKQSPCSDCTSGWAKDVNKHGYQYAYAVGRHCSLPNDSYKITDIIKVPCGAKTIKAGRHCERALILATNTYSPMALENMFDE